MTAHRSPAQWVCLVGGALLLIRGAVGLAMDPAFELPGEGWHQLFHMLTGAVLLLVAREADLAIAATLAFGTVYLAIDVIGIASGTDVLGLIPVSTQDNIVHGTIALVTLGAGIATLALKRPPAPA